MDAVFCALLKVPLSLSTLFSRMLGPSFFAREARVNVFREISGFLGTKADPPRAANGASRGQPPSQAGINATIRALQDPNAVAKVAATPKAATTPPRPEIKPPAAGNVRRSTSTHTPAPMLTNALLK